MRSGGAQHPLLTSTLEVEVLATTGAWVAFDLRSGLYELAAELGDAYVEFAPDAPGGRTYTTSGRVIPRDDAILEVIDEDGIGTRLQYFLPVAGTRLRVTRLRLRTPNEFGE